MMNSIATCHIAMLFHLLLLLPSLVSVIAYIIGNVTISFTTNATSSTSSACPGGDQSKELFLTTYGTPYAYTCFNISDIFSQSNANGFQPGRGTRGIHEPDDRLGPQGVNYTLGNLDLYSPSNNYTQVTITQMNLTRLEAKEGKVPGSRIYVYTLRNCEQANPEEDVPMENHPWYGQSCQTTASGVCHTVTQGIQSFSIQGVGDNQCTNWLFLGAASTVSQQSARGIVGLVAIVAFWVML